MREVKRYTILSAKGATGLGNFIQVSDFRNCVVQVATASSANLTIKCKGSLGATAPTFVEGSKTVANAWEYVAMVDLNTPTTVVTGSTGLAFTGTDDVRLFEININSLDWLTFDVTARSAGSVTVTITLTDNR